MKKCVAIIVMICLSASLLMGCGGSGSGGKSVDAQSKEDAQAVETQNEVQFCSDSQCMMAKTDNTGAAVFNVDPGNYEAHILKPPAGYQKSSETAQLTADDRIAVLLLLKEGEELKAAEAADGAAAAAEEALKAVE